MTLEMTPVRHDSRGWRILNEIHGAKLKTVLGSVRIFRFDDDHNTDINVWVEPFGEHEGMFWFESGNIESLESSGENLEGIKHGLERGIVCEITHIPRYRDYVKEVARFFLEESNYFYDHNENLRESLRDFCYQLKTELGV